MSIQLLFAVLVAGTLSGDNGPGLNPGRATSVIVSTGQSSTSPGGTGIVFDNVGIVQGQSATTTDPLGYGLRPGACAPSDATCAAANLHLFGGQDTTTIAIDGADPSVTCADDDDTVTVTVYGIQGAATCQSGCTLTEEVDWTATSSVAATCASLAAAVDALDDVGATCTSPNVLITLDKTAGAVVLAESTAGCTTVAAGTAGVIRLLGLGSVSAPTGGIDFNTGGGIAGAGVGLFFYTSGSAEMVLDGNGFRGASGSSALYLLNEAVSGTNPGVSKGNDLDTGIGASTDDCTTLIAGGATSFDVCEGEVAAGETQIHIDPCTFANLGTPANGTFCYCSDCTKATPCAGTGNGSLAKRLNGAWDCD